MNIPNSLSLLRVFLVAPFLIAVLYHHYALALTLFVAAGISDFLDGYLARRLNQKSLLGSYLDPLGDKLLCAVAYIALASQGLLPAWLAVLVVAKDLYTILGAGIIYSAGRSLVADPSLWGKSSTLLQIVTIGLVLVATLVPLDSLLSLLFGITGLITVIACVHYVWRGLEGFPEDVS
jgi:cardiolipin synthase